MKDGRTHLAYKAEHVQDVDSELLLSAKVYAADAADSETLGESLASASAHLEGIGSEATIRDVAADRGYHKIGKLADWRDEGYRTYVPEQTWPHKHNWENRSEEERRAYELNRRRCRSGRGRKLQRLRRERMERSMAHVCDTGGGRRSWIRGRVEVGKDYLMRAAGFNLGVMMRKLFGVGSPRSLQGGGLYALLRALMARYSAVTLHLRLAMEKVSDLSAVASRNCRTAAGTVCLLRSA